MKMSNNFTFVVKLLHEMSDQVFTEVIISLLVARKPETFNVAFPRIGKKHLRTKIKRRGKGKRFIPLKKKRRKTAKKVNK